MTSVKPYELVESASELTLMAVVSGPTWKERCRECICSQKLSDLSEPEFEQPMSKPPRCHHYGGHP